MSRSRTLGFGGGLVLAVCAAADANVVRLAPAHEPSVAPPVCHVISILADSPAQHAAMERGDVIQSVNGQKAPDADGLSDLINQAGAEADLVVIGKDGAERHVLVPLKKEPPRLGVMCDLTGLRKIGVSSAGNETVTIFNGPYAVTVSGILDKGLAFLRVRVNNHSDHPLRVSRALFTVSDSSQAPMVVLSPAEVMYFLHGDEAVSLLQPPASAQAGPEDLEVPVASPVRRAAPKHKPRAYWTRADESYTKANANYLDKESLWPSDVSPDSMADGLIFCLAPRTLPFTVQAQIEGHTYTTRLGLPQPTAGRMSEDALIQFFEAQKKGTPVKITLRNGKVWVGKYASYDADNEIVWFDTPSGILLNTSSFGLRHIQSAEPIAPDADKKPAPEPVN